MALWFLDITLVEELHEMSLQYYGGTSGCRDRGGIESALGAAQNAYCYGQGDHFDIAAAYAFHIAQAQAYLDGNKRTAIASALAFLAGNGFAKAPNPDFLADLYNAMIALSDRSLDKPGLAKIMRDYFTST